MSKLKQFTIKSDLRQSTVNIPTSGCEIPQDTQKKHFKIRMHVSCIHEDPQSYTNIALEIGFLFNKISISFYRYAKENEEDIKEFL